MKRDWMARELTVEILVGVFMVVVLFGLGFFTIVLSRDTWFGTRYEMEVVFSHTMGLRDGDSVVVRGMPVGRVKDLRLKEDGVHAFLLLDHPLHPKTDYRASVVASSVLGGKYLEIHEGSRDMPPLEAGTVLHGEPPYDLAADAAELVSAIKKGIVEEGVLANLRDTVDLLHEAAVRVSQGKGTLGRLLSENDEEYEDIVQTTRDLRRLVERVEKGEGTLGKLLSKDDSVYRDLADAAQSLKRVAGQIERSEGLVGRLVSDDTLYREVEQTIRELRAWIDDSRETSPVVSFTSILFGAF
jgi:phospholipid/cholesterol/gamma-HCH transport system substrate-binding protein